MFKLIIFLTFVSYSHGIAIPPGFIPQSEGRIVGGTPITIKSAPWQVSVLRNGAHSCGGSIYSNTIIITAAHCLLSTTESILRVRAGSSYWNSGGVYLQISAFLHHENFNSVTKANDIGLLRLSSPLSYGSTIQNIQLANVAPMNGAPAMLTGWGSLKQTAGSIPTQLQKIDLQIIRRTPCASSIYGYGSDIKSSMICASALGKDACKGDTGGPLVSEGLLVGIVSWNIECNLERYPGVYADIAVLRTWIVETALRIESN